MKVRISANEILAHISLRCTFKPILNTHLRSMTPLAVSTALVIALSQISRSISSSACGSLDSCESSGSVSSSDKLNAQSTSVCGISKLVSASTSHCPLSGRAVPAIGSAPLTTRFQLCVRTRTESCDPTLPGGASVPRESLE